MAGILDWLKNWSKSNKERHDMSSFFEEEKPKAHDSIDSIIKESISPEHQIILSDILENIATGGMGGTLKTGLKATKSIAGSDFLQKLFNKFYHFFIFQ